MPLTHKGNTILAAMIEEYGPVKGPKVFYASRNAGTIVGVEEKRSRNLRSGDVMHADGGAWYRVISIRGKRVEVETLRKRAKR